MTTQRDPDAILAAWLEDGPNRLPDTTRRAIGVASRSTDQRRRPIWAPWRYTPMNSFAKLAAAAVVVVAVGAMGLALLGPGSSGPNVVPHPSASPSAAPSASPSGRPAVTPTPMPTSPPLSGHFTSNLHGISIAYPAGWLTLAATQTLPPGGAVSFGDPAGDFLYHPVLEDHLFLALTSQPLGAKSSQQWLADQATVEECPQTEPATIAGASGAIGRDCDVALVTSQGRGYVIRLYTSGDEPWIDAVYDRSWFDQVLATVVLDPRAASTAAPPPAPPASPSASS